MFQDKYTVRGNPAPRRCQPYEEVSWQICSEFRKKSYSNVKRQQLNGFAISQYSAGYVRENKFFLSSLIESFVCFSVHRTVRGPQSIVQNL